MRIVPGRIPVCHCQACQRRTGFVRVGGDGGSTLPTLCPQCGATVGYLSEGMDDSIAIPIGACADATFPPPRVSVYEDRKHPWVVVPEGVRHWA